VEGLLGRLWFGLVHKAGKSVPNFDLRWKKSYEGGEMKSETNSLSRKDLQLLFREVGSEARLRLVLRDFYGRMTSDVLVGFFFVGKDSHEIAEKQLHFLMRAMGQSSVYRGKSPARAHENLPPILAGHFDRRLKLLEQTLRDHEFSENAIQLWLRFEGSFRAGIVT
jgi:hemoglobin